MDSVRPLDKDEGLSLVAPERYLAEAVVRSKDLLNAGRPPARGQSNQIVSRENFRASLEKVNSLARQQDHLSVQDAKATLTKAEALRAWAAFDRRLTEDEKKEANRAMTRTIVMLGVVAEREQPITYLKGRPKGTAKLAGPVKWLMRELGWTKAKAQLSRRLIHDEQRTRTIIDLGVHWLTALGLTTSDRSVKHAVLTRMGAWVKMNNSLAEALKVHPPCIGKELSRVRSIKAWCEAYETALLQRRAVVTPVSEEAPHG